GALGRYPLDEARRADSSVERRSFLGRCRARLRSRALQRRVRVGASNALGTTSRTKGAGIAEGSTWVGVRKDFVTGGGGGAFCGVRRARSASAPRKSLALAREPKAAIASTNAPAS